MKSGQTITDEFLAELSDQRSLAGTNLLGALSEILEEHGGSTAARNTRVSRLRDFIAVARSEESAVLGNAFPPNSGATFSLPDRLIWIPRGIPKRHRTGFASSRLGNTPDQFPEWFDTLRTVCARLNPETDAIVCTRETAGFDFQYRAAWLFGLPLIEISVAAVKLTIDEWLFNLPTLEDEPVDDCFPVFVSPQFERDGSSVNKVSPNTAGRDAIHALACETIYALRVTASGNIHQALRLRCESAWHQPGSVLVSSQPDAVPEGVRDELQNCGALQHLLLEAVTDRKPDGEAELAKNRSADPVVDHNTTAGTNSILEFDQILPRIEGWLSHCTRRRVGPWPDEDRLTWLDDLLFRRLGANHTAIAALCRIVRTRKLVATSELIRGTIPVVSFSAKRLPDLLAARTFRSHLSRWDCEPYGVSIDRTVLESLGARSVIYTDDSQYKKLSEQDRPFFQKLSNGNDWTAEDEWRLIGDLRLDQITRDAAVVFVPTLEEAEFVSRFTPFDVCITAERLP